jgi:hypothetical protein
MGAPAADGFDVTVAAKRTVLVTQEDLCHDRHRGGAA